MYFAQEVPEDIDINIQTEEEKQENPGLKDMLGSINTSKKRKRRTVKSVGFVILKATSKRIDPIYAALLWSVGHVKALYRKKKIDQIYNKLLELPAKRQGKREKDKKKQT